MTGIKFVWIIINEQSIKITLIKKKKKTTIKQHSSKVYVWEEK